MVIFHNQTQYGGGKSTAFALIYDDEASQKKFEPKHRLIRVCIISVLDIICRWLIDGQSGLQTKPPIVSRKLQKERKNRAKKVFFSCLSSGSLITLLQFRGTKKSKAAEAPKKK